MSRFGLIRALLGLPSSCHGGDLEGAAAGVAGIIGAASGRAADAVGWPERHSWVVLGAGAAVNRPSKSVSKSSCARAQSAGSAQRTRPSALPGSMVVLGCFSHQPEALSCHPYRGWAASTGRGGAPKAVTSHFWPAAMAPRLAGPRADDAVASHRAADCAVPSIAPGPMLAASAGELWPGFVRFGPRSRLAPPFFVLRFLEF
jgi:hypothetical protein